MRRFKIKNFLKYFLIVIKIFIIVKRPISIINHYIRESSPKKIELRSGHIIYTSKNPYDVVTFVLVFCKKDYGEIKKGSTVIDVGSNIGIFALYSLISGAGYIECFEPCSEAFDILTLNIKRNGFEEKALLHRVAVTDNDSSIALISKNSSPYNTVKEIRNETNLSEFEEVKTVNLVNVLSKLNSIDLIKMDCEGAEFIIFPTFSRHFLDKVKEIRMELHGSKKKLISSLSFNPYQVIEKNVNDLWFVR